MRAGLQSFTPPPAKGIANRQSGALSQAQRQAQVQFHVDHYNENPGQHARALRTLGVPRNAINLLQRQSLRGAANRPAQMGLASGGPTSLLGLAQSALSDIGMSSVAHPVRAAQDLLRSQQGGWQDASGKWHLGSEPPHRLTNIKPSLEMYPFGGGEGRIAKLAGGIKGLRATPKMPADMSPEVQASAKKITAALSFGGAKKARAAQEALYTAERTKRAGAAQEAMSQTPGVAGHYAALHELKGPLPKVEFNALKGKFGDKEVQNLFTHISNSDKLRPYEKVDTHRALMKTLGGEVPTPRERKLLYNTFGPEFGKSIMGSLPKLARIKNAGLEIANMPRSVMASADVSAPFRQGLVAGARHPAMFAKNFVPMLKEFGSERVYQEARTLIHEHPLYGDAMDHGLSLTELGSLKGREEQFMSNYAEHLPLAGRVVRASGRAYVGFLDKMRMDMYAYHTKAAQGFYGGTLSTEQKRGLATFINSATGRGDLGRFQNAAVHLNTLFFSPRLLASRFNLLNPTYYAKLDPYSRQQALKSMRNLIGFVSSTLYLAHLGGAKVEMDPRNADWAKIKIGKTRVDLLGGFQQPVRLAAQLLTGKIISSTTGDTQTLGPGFGKMNRQDILKRFLEGKLAPTASVINDLLKGSTFGGQPLSAQSEVASHTIPLAIQDARDLYHQHGNIPGALLAYAGSATGIGVQTYGPQDKTKVEKQKIVKLRAAFDQNLRRYYQMGITPQINKALNLREARAVYLAKHLKKNSKPVDRYNAQVDLMVQMKMITKAQAATAKKWAASQDPHVVKARTSSLGRMYFGGDVLSSASKKIRARGGHFWLSDPNSWAP